MDSIFSQRHRSGTGQRGSATLDKTRRKRRQGFKPPLKDHGSVPSSAETLTGRSSEQLGTDQSNRVCHTVLSYCEHEDEGDHEECIDTQPLSMFSGERVQGPGDTQDIAELDDLLFPPDDPFSISHSSERSKQDDPIYKLSNPFSDSQVVAQENIDSAYEQRVPASPVASRPSENEEEMDVDSDEGGIEGIPRRQFKTHSSGRRYNLDLLPRHYRKGPRKSIPVKAGARPSVNWARDISILERGMATDELRCPLSVYSVPLSAEDSRQKGRQDSTGNTSRENRSNLSKMDISICTRTKEQQLLIDLEVLNAISKTRDEIRDLKARYLAMTSSGHDMTSLIQHPKNKKCSNTDHYLKPQLQVQVITK